MRNDIDVVLNSLAKSKFRNSFHLNKKMKEYVSKNGINIIRKHAYEILENRIFPANPINDGKQTPYRQVHPVFIAQHACGCCCRGCLEKWHHIPKERELEDREIRYLVALIMEWIRREYRIQKRG